MSESPIPQHEARKQPGVAREYRTDQIVVYWEPRLCTHSARCLQGLPQVFDTERHPWVDVTAASADQIAEVIRRCPTSALRYERLDGAEQEEGVEPTTIQARRDGPLWVRGKLQIVNQNGSVRQVTRAVLCRCGHSANRPFCDNTHRRIGFSTSEEG
jgi:uncharacterized Fe-S cluster protein YjdI